MYVYVCMCMRVSEHQSPHHNLPVSKGICGVEQARERGLNACFSLPRGRPVSRGRLGSERTGLPTDTIIFNNDFKRAVHGQEAADGCVRIERQR